MTENNENDISNWDLIDINLLNNKDRLFMNSIKLFNIDLYNFLNKTIMFTRPLYNLEPTKSIINLYNNNIKQYKDSIDLKYNYYKSFKYAYDKMINECINVCYPSIIEINNNLDNNHIKNCTLNVDTDEFIIIVKNLKHIHLKSQFINNYGFQTDLKKHLQNFIPNINLEIINNNSNEYIFSLIYNI